MSFVAFTPKLSGAPCSPADIRSFEEFAHASLPQEYTEFLLRWNGCVPASDADTFTSADELPGGNEITVHQFFSLSDKNPPMRSLYAELEVDVGFMPMTTIPIGEDSFGNVIGLDCETGLVNWTLCEQRFALDCLRNFDLGITFSAFIESLKPGPYMNTN